MRHSNPSEGRLDGGYPEEGWGSEDLAGGGRATVSSFQLFQVYLSCRAVCPDVSPLSAGAMAEEDNLHHWLNKVWHFRPTWDHSFGQYLLQGSPVAGWHCVTVITLLAFFLCSIILLPPFLHRCHSWINILYPRSISVSVSRKFKP